MQSRGIFQSLAEPNLVAESGKEASFLAGGEFPIPVVQGSQNGSAVSIQFKEFGVRLNFTPTVNGDRVHLKVKPEVSTLDYANGVSLSGLPHSGALDAPHRDRARAAQRPDVRHRRPDEQPDELDAAEDAGHRRHPDPRASCSRAARRNKAQTELVVMITPEILPNDSDGVTIEPAAPGRAVPGAAAREQDASRRRPTPSRRIAARPSACRCRRRPTRTSARCRERAAEQERRASGQTRPRAEGGRSQRRRRRDAAKAAEAAPAPAGARPEGDGQGGRSRGRGAGAPGEGRARAGPERQASGASRPSGPPRTRPSAPPRTRARQEKANKNKQAGRRGRRAAGARSSGDGRSARARQGPRGRRRAGGDDRTLIHRFSRTSPMARLSGTILSDDESFKAQLRTRCCACRPYRSSWRRPPRGNPDIAVVDGRARSCRAPWRSSSGCGRPTPRPASSSWPSDSQPRRHPAVDARRRQRVLHLAAGQGGARRGHHAHGRPPRRRRRRRRRRRWCSSAPRAAPAPPRWRSTARSRSRGSASGRR